jgi:hypothetical protein
VALAGVGGGWWNGTVYCNLTAPSGTVVHLAPILNASAHMHNSAVPTYCNWSYDPHESGNWTATIDPVMESTPTAKAVAIIDHTDTFNVERSGEWLGRQVGNMASIFWMLFIVLCIVAVLLIFVNKLGGRGEKK